jgi:D-alanyl-lipoteichoic acid acyltransferase DltB (MBOAT superfamily)
MNFNQPEYGLLLLLVFWGFWGLRRHATLRELLLLAASYVFYGAWNPRYLLLLALSTLVDFAVGRALGATRSPTWRRVLLVLSLTFNLGLLAVFKYYNFFSSEAAAALRQLGFEVHPAQLDVVLPAGISFYTFQTINYVVDVYRGVLPPCRSLLEFAVFISFFPHLVAGPILRARTFLPQVAREPVYDDAKATGGLCRILLGLTKKVLFADFVGYALVDPVFKDLARAPALLVLLALYGYAVQIYNDFSGYSDIAIGSANMLGFDIPENFDRPYRAAGPREFWRRWHISLSSWLRDYLYIPLGGSRGPLVRTIATLMITMLLGGLWHGARWTFVVWGALHGLALVAERLSGEGRWGRLATFHFVCLTWMFFRSDSLAQALLGLRQMASAFSLPVLDAGQVVALALVATSLLIHFGDPEWKETVRRRFLQLAPPLQALAAGGVVLLVSGLAARARPFLYFQF